MHNRFAPPEAVVADKDIKGSRSTFNSWEKAAAWLFLILAVLGILALAITSVVISNEIRNRLASGATPLDLLLLPVLWLAGALLLVLGRKMSVPVLAVYLLFLLLLPLTRYWSMGRWNGSYLGIATALLALALAVHLLLRGKLR